MKEIKFRAWMEDNKSLIFLSATAFGDLVDNHKKGFELMQFTGLKDRKGKEIYEGDIVTWFADGINKKAVVEWANNGGWIANRFDKVSECSPLIYNFQSFIPISRNKFDGEVIGNIYENKELFAIYTKKDKIKDKELCKNCKLPKSSHFGRSYNICTKFKERENE